MDRVRKQLEVPNIPINHLKGKSNVGILDSGIFYHNDLKQYIKGVRSFVKDETNINDYFGHGTHVAGIIAGDGKNSRGLYRGICHGANLYIGKILNKNGKGDLSYLLNGLEWLYENRKEFKLNIINISVGLFPYKDYFNQDKTALVRFNQIIDICKALNDENILVVVAAGNNGSVANSISSLGMNHYVLTVGCNDGDYMIKNKKMCSEYSSCGINNPKMMKPDIVAPGTSIVSCDHRSQGYVKKSGTSMATAIVSGVVAYYTAIHPDYSIIDLKNKLLYTAIKIKGNPIKIGHGMINSKELLT